MPLMLHYLKEGQRDFLTAENIRSFAGPQHNELEENGETILEQLPLSSFDETVLLYQAAHLSLLYALVCCNDTSLHDKPQMFTDYRALADWYQSYKIDPGFPSDGVDEIEETKLVQFANIMRILMLFNRKSSTRQEILHLVSRVAERKVSYVTGSGETTFTKRRVCIYQCESGERILYE